MQALVLERDYHLTTPQGHYDLLHNTHPQEGVSILWEKTGRHGSRSWHKLTPDSAEIPYILRAQAGAPDRYVTVNEFHGWRLVRLLKSLRSLFVDIDRKVKLDELLDALSMHQLPHPSFVMFTGRGVHAYWLHEPAGAGELPTWQQCQKTLIDALRPLGVDPVAKDCARVLRLAGSVNSKTGDTVHGVVLNPQPWNFRRLGQEVLGHEYFHDPLGYLAPSLAPTTKAEVRSLDAARAEKGLRPSTGNIYVRWYLVYQDLLRIARWYDFGGVPEGHRNNWMFTAAVALSWFTHADTLRDELLAQGRIWTPGLSVRELSASIQAPLDRAEKSAAGERFTWTKDGAEISVDPRYRMRRSTLWNWFGEIVPPELETSLRAVISEQTHEQRKREGRGNKVSRETYLAGFSNSAEATKPWEALGMSRAKYYRKKRIGAV